MNLAIFDIDGTLTLGTSHFKAFVRALEETCGFAGVSANWQDYRHPSDSGIVAQVSRQQRGRRLTAREVRSFKRRYLALLREACETATAVSGSEAFLRRLKTQGWCVAYATGNWRVTARCKLSAAGLPTRSIPLSGADDGESRVEILRAAVALARVRSGCRRFRRVVSFGDATWDLEAARALGLPFIGLDTGSRGVELTAAGASHLLPDYCDEERVWTALHRASIPGTKEGRPHP